MYFTEKCKRCLMTAAISSLLYHEKKKKTKNKYPIIIMNGSEDAVFLCSVKNVLNKGDPPFYWYYEV